MVHHAQLLIGTLAEALPHIAADDRVESSDVLRYVYKRFGIDDARALVYEASLRPVEKESRVFLVSFESITTEAQNALLKLFEEPSQTARFYIVTPNGEMLLPTLRSRCLVIGCERTNAFGDEVQQFLAAPHADRLELIARRAKEKDTEWFAALLAGIEQWAQEKKDADMLRDVLFVRNYDRTQSSSLKMLFEHLALSLPRVG